MAGRKSDFTLTKLDDLFSTQEQRDEEKLSKIRDIPLTEIDDFPDHPFKVRVTRIWHSSLRVLRNEGNHSGDGKAERGRQIRTHFRTQAKASL